MKRKEIEERVSVYADLFLGSQKSYMETCKNYQVSPKELDLLFSEILSITEFEKYQALCEKYPSLRESETQKILRKVK